MGSSSKSGLVSLRQHFLSKLRLARSLLGNGRVDYKLDGHRVLFKCTETCAVS